MSALEHNSYSALRHFSTDQKVLIEKARVIQSNSHWNVGSFVICACVAGWALYDPRKAVYIWLWLSTLVLMAVLNVLEEIWVRKHPQPPERAPQRLRASTRSSLIFGLLWAVGVLVLWPAERIDLQVFLMFLTAGMAAAAQLSFSMHLPAFYAFFLPMLGSLIFVTLWAGGMVNYLIAFATTTYLVASVRFVKTLSNIFVGAIRSRFEIADLAESLKLQKEVAEAASQSKSRFLAAASHDLRQPVHSLSLFVGALAAQPQNAEGTRLITHIRSTVESLGTLFDSLLNISKLDANTVQPVLKAVDLRQLLQKICDAEAAPAQDKGLALHLNVPSLIVTTDPILLDRVIRNLVANAVRYTDQGAVVISARLRAGRVLVRVGDTGIGIPPDMLETVFDEFVQLHNAERDRNQGIGLGLSIVRRLATLLQIKLTFRSRVGRGSVFSLWLEPAPSSANRQVTATPTASTAAELVTPGPNPSTAYVLVIDDDAAIRIGMTALLSSWGYQVLAVAGLQEYLPLMASQKQVPCLVICDMRLRNGENGIETVAYVRTQYNDDLPAILITGDTAPERLQQAAQSGLVLLHKPVSPAALRSAMANVAQGAQA
jgi:signal transduction histidine kinase/CheY-like chemotaxis protein